MGFLDKLLKQNNGQSTAFGRLVEKIGTGVSSSANDLLGDALGSVKGAVSGVTNSISDITTSKADRNSLIKDSGKYFHQKEVSIANLNGDAILNILNGVTDGNLINAGLQALQLYNYGTKWAIYTDQYVDKEMYPFRYAYLAESSKTSAFLDESETNTPSLALLDSIEDPTILGYTVKFDFDNSPLFDLSENSAHKTSALSFVNLYKQQHPEMKGCEIHIRNLVEDFKKVFESPESLDGTTMYQGAYKQHYIMAIDGLQKLDNPFVKFDEDELKFILHEDVRMFTNKMAYTYRNLAYSYALGKDLIPENLLRFNMYIKISDQRSFTRSTNEKDAMRDAMRNAYSRIIYELKDCQLFFENPLKDMNMMGFGSVDSSYAQLTMRVKYRKVNRIFYGSLYDSKFSDFIISDKFHNPDDTKSYEFLNQTKFEDRRISEKGVDSSKRMSTNNNMQVVPSLSSQYSTLKSRGLFTTDDDDSALTRFIKTLGNKAVEKGLTYVDEGLDKVETAIDKLGISVRDKLQSLVGKSTTSLGNVNDGFVAINVSQPSVSSIDTTAISSTINTPFGNLQTPGYSTVAAIGLQNLANNPATVNPITLQNLSYGLTTTYGIKSVNINGVISYVNVSPVGLNHLMTPENSVAPLTKEVDLMIASPLTDAIKIDNIMVPNKINNNLNSVEDLMVGYITNQSIGLKDLMVADGNKITAPNESDLMVPSAVNTNISSTVDLMVPDSLTDSIVKNDLMVSDTIVEGLNSEIDLMIPDKGTKGLKDKIDLMIADESHDAFKGEGSFMNSETEVLPLKEVIDLMVAEDSLPKMVKENLMETVVKTQKIGVDNLMIPGELDEPIAENNLMQAPVFTSEPITEKSIMVPQIIEDHIQENNLAGIVENNTAINYENLMQGETSIIGAPKENLMNVEEKEIEIPLENLMIAESQSPSMPFEDLMVADSADNAIKAENLMNADKLEPTITSDNLMQANDAGIKTPKVENLMNASAFKKYVKKK